MIEHPPIVSRRTPVTVVALLVVLFCAPLVSAPDAGAVTGAASTAAKEGDGPGKLMLVMDSSGSMKEPTGGGQTRIAAARTALGNVIGQLPDDQEVGLRVYGAKVFSRDDKGACTDSQRVVDLGTDNRGDLRSAVKKYRPYGETPIGYALQQAGKDLGDSGQRNIVLVSDGEPNCEPDPCEVARDLGKQGISLRIDVVGLDVNGAAREKLECIARAGNGNYYDASSSRELTDSMVHIAERAARSFEPIGEPVTGTPDRESAPEITEGDWRDVADPKNPTTHYRIKRSLQGSTIRASVAYRAVGSTKFVDARLTTPDGAECDFNTGLATNDQLSSAVVASTPYGDEACLEAEELILAVEYRADTPAVPLEIRVSEQPPVANLDALPEPDSTVSYQPPPKSGKAQEVTGGTSFNHAEPLTPGSYSGTIVPGESLTFRMEADWGQQPVATASFPRASGDLEPAQRGNAHILLDIFSPGRAPSAALFTQPGTETEVSLLSTSTSKATATTAPVNFANFQTSSPDNGPTAAGDYTIVLTLQDTGENASLPVPYQLDVAATGQAQPGPEFEEKPLEGVETQAPDAGGDAPSEEGAGAENGSDEGGMSIGMVFGGIGLLIALAVIGWLLRNNFRRTS